MSTKTCLLCGRPLSRIRPGSGGDFCTREHRTQYRLRKSMDCLTEANKVATLARRRETPKPVFGLPAGSNALPRGFMENPLLPRHSGPALKYSKARSHFSLRAAGTVAIVAPGGSGKKLDVHGFPFHLGQVSQALAPRIAAPPIEARRQAMRTERTLHVAAGAVQGNAFRVSARAGFRPPPLAVRFERETPPPQRELSRQGSKAVEMRQPVSAAGNREAAVKIPRPPMVPPTAPPVKPAYIAWPEAFTVHAGSSVGVLDFRYGACFFKATWAMSGPKSTLAPKVNPFSNRRITRLSRLPLNAREAVQRGRLTFGEFGFTGATEAARLNWAGISNGKAPVLEYKV